MKTKKRVCSLLIMVILTISLLPMTGKAYSNDFQRQLTEAAVDVYFARKEATHVADSSKILTYAIPFNVENEQYYFTPDITLASNENEFFLNDGSNNYDMHRKGYIHNGHIYTSRLVSENALQTECPHLNDYVTVVYSTEGDAEPFEHTARGRIGEWCLRDGDAHFLSLDMDEKVSEDKNSWGFVFLDDGNFAGWYFSTSSLSSYYFNSVPSLHDGFVGLKWYDQTTHLILRNNPTPSPEPEAVSTPVPEEEPETSPAAAIDEEPAENTETPEENTDPEASPTPTPESSVKNETRGGRTMGISTVILLILGIAGLLVFYKAR
ncbi:MAG: procyclic acidic repetitive family protein [Oscillospiraceae bacterium]|nr:procyclic acidic repetitive family protein [Oscillospiraceae bacterium]